MRGREGVVDVDVAQHRELVDEARVVLLLFLVEAQVLQQQHFAGLQRAHRLLGERADAVLGEGHRLAERLRQRLDQRLQRHLGHALAVGPAEVAEHDHLGALGRELAERRRGALDARRIGHLAVLHRHVEVDAHQHALAGHVDGIDRLEGRLGHFSNLGVGSCG